MEDNEKKAKLEKIEKTIEPLVKTQEYWVEVYKLLKSVEEQELYDPEYQSFTAWLKSFAERYDVTLSLLWLQKKSGKFYENYCEYYKALSLPVTPLEKITIVPYVLTMIEKITAGNMREAKELVDKAEAGSISRNELQTLWNLEKQEREKNGLPTKRLNRHDEEEFEKISYQNFNAQATTLSDIGSVLCNPAWLVPSKQVRKKYKLFTEFTKEEMFKGAFILAENYTKPFDGHKKHKFNIHMLYIKLEDDDLDGEPDFPGYKGYADYYWVVVPYDMLDKGKRYIKDNPDIGLLCFSKPSNNIHIIQQSSWNDKCDSRMDTVEMLANYML